MLKGLINALHTTASDPSPVKDVGNLISLADIFVILDGVLTEVRSVHAVRVDILSYHTARIMSADIANTFNHTNNQYYH